MKKSFTLIEILVVIVVIGILSAFILVGMSSITSKANIAKSQAFLNSMDNSILLGRVSQWKLDVNTGTTPDAWGTNTGTVTGATLLSTGCVYDGCLSFNGSSNYVTLASNYVFTSNNTLSFWGKINAQDFLGIIGGNVGNLSYLRFGYNAGEYNHDICGETDTDGDEIDLHFNSTLNISQWHNFVITQDSSKLWKLYLDGVLQTDTATTTNANLTMRVIGIGRAGNDFFNGSMDDFRMYNQISSMSEIQRDYYSGLNKLIVNNDIDGDEYINRLAELRNNRAKY
jgi:prepilin-type N-terminal cleavage/methylation domain-containing protein